MTLKEANDWIKRLHRMKVILINDEGKTRCCSMKCFVPMQRVSKGGSGPVEDVEVIVDKVKNHYFSVKMMLKGDSWVKEIQFLNQPDRRIRKQPPISGWKKGQMQDHHYIETAIILRKLWAVGI